MPNAAAAAHPENQHKTIISFSIIKALWSLFPPLAMQTLQFTNPNPRTSPAGFSGSFNANNQGYSGTGRVTFGNENRSVYVQGQVDGGWSGGRPSVGGMVGGTIRF